MSTREPVRLTAADALRLRMAALLLADHPAADRPAADRPAAGHPAAGHPAADRPAGRPDDVAGIVTWFGAMQAQDVASGMWSLGVRLPGSTHADVLAALERREALRTWPMRGTVHLVPSRDARWMVQVLGARPLAGAAARRAMIGLADDTAERAVQVLAEALAGGGRLTRAQCLRTLADAGVAVAGQLGYHILWYASQRGVTCIAPHVDGEQTFVLLDEWVPDPHLPERDEALGLIASRYFRSHGPTTRQDFAGWTGLTAADAKRAIAVAGDALAGVRVDDVEMFLDPALLGAGAPKTESADVLALPGFDEYLLGFKDRSLMLDAAHKQAVIPGNNGVFQSTIVRGGRVIGTWKRSLTKRFTVVDVRPLVELSTVDRDRVERALLPYAGFMGLPLQVRWP